MTDYTPSTPNYAKASRISKIFGDLLAVANEDTTKLVKHLRNEHKYSYEKIGIVLEVSPQAIQSRFFPKGGKKS